MKSWTGFAFGMTLVLMLPLAIKAQGSSDPILGTWTMDPVKSKFDPGPTPSSQTRIYEQTADGLKVTIQSTYADGTKRTRVATYKEDGRTYAIPGAANSDAVAVTRNNASRETSKLIRGGKVIGELVLVASKDHKVLTATYTLTTRDGRPEHDVAVFDRQ